MQIAKKMIFRIRCSLFRFRSYWFVSEIRQKRRRHRRSRLPDRPGTDPSVRNCRAVLFVNIHFLRSRKHLNQYQAFASWGGDYFRTWQSEVIVVTAQLARYGCEDLPGHHMTMAFDPLGEVFQRPLNLSSGCARFKPLVPFPIESPTIFEPKINESTVATRMKPPEPQ